MRNDINFVIFTLVVLMLIEMAIQHPLKQLIFLHCNVTPEYNWPAEFEIDNKTIPVAVRLEIDRLVEIDDVLETFTTIGRVVTYWHSRCIENLYKSDKWPLKNNFSNILGNFQPGELWQPQFRHRNSMNSFELGGDRECNVDPSTGWVKNMYTGKFISYCDLNFLKFPFDQ